MIELTEIAHDVGIATDYHLNETPMLEQPDFKHESGNSTYITPKDWRRIDAVIDWLIDKNRSGYRMVNSVRRLEEMKAFMRGTLPQWDCRAGQNSLIIRTDGTLAPCFPMYSATQDWGVARQPRFESRQLARHEGGMPKALFFHVEPQSLVLLRRFPRDPVGSQAGGPRIPGDDGQL